MANRPFAFLRLGDRWVNMAMVTDVEDHGDHLTVFLAADQARRISDSEALDVARRYILDDAEDVKKLRNWMRLNDEE